MIDTSNATFDQTTTILKALRDEVVTPLKAREVCTSLE